MVRRRVVGQECRRRARARLGGSSERQDRRGARVPRARPGSRSGPPSQPGLRAQGRQRAGRAAPSRSSCWGSYWMGSVTRMFPLVRAPMAASTWLGLPTASPAPPVAQAEPLATLIPGGRARATAPRRRCRPQSSQRRGESRNRVTMDLDAGERGHLAPKQCGCRVVGSTAPVDVALGRLQRQGRRGAGRDARKAVTFAAAGCRPHGGASTTAATPTPTPAGRVQHERVPLRRQRSPSGRHGGIHHQGTAASRHRAAAAASGCSVPTSGLPTCRHTAPTAPP